MAFKLCSRQTGHDNNQKYLWNKSKTGRGGGSRATPHQSPRAFCMTRPGAGQSTGSPNRGQLWTMRCPVRSGPGSEWGKKEQVHAGSASRWAQCAVDGGAVRVRRSSLLLRPAPSPHTHRAERSLALGEG